jgi:hypothetical protein
MPADSLFAGAGVGAAFGFDELHDVATSNVTSTKAMADVMLWVFGRTQRSIVSDR